MSTPSFREDSYYQAILEETQVLNEIRLCRQSPCHLHADKFKLICASECLHSLELLKECDNGCHYVLSRSGNMEPRFTLIKKNLCCFFLVKE